MAGRAYLSFLRPVNLDTMNALLSNCHQAMDKGFSEITLLFSSEGGQIVHGFAAYNQLKGLPIKLTTYNIGSVNSIANIIFLAGENRLATPNATFLFHGTYFPFSGNVPRAHIAEALASLDADEKRMKEEILKRTKLIKGEIDELMQRGSTKDASYAMEKGIVHEIAELSIPPGAHLAQI